MIIVRNYNGTYKIAFPTIEDDITIYRSLADKYFLNKIVCNRFSSAIKAQKAINDIEEAIRKPG